MILINVLSLVAVASAILLVMVSDQETSIDRSVRFREAAQASALARAGETSAMVTLRRDAEESPEVDHFQEPWAKVLDRNAVIVGGTFSLSVIDAQSRFNLNNLGQSLAPTLTFAPIAAALRIDPALGDRLAAHIREKGPLTHAEQLRNLGVDAETFARLRPLVTTLPHATSINVNTASEELIAMISGDAAAARMLVAQRDRAGFVTDEDIRALGLFMPPGAGLTSDYYWVRTRVRIGDTSQTLTSLLRRVKRNGRAQVITIGRWRGAAARGEVPPF